MLPLSINPDVPAAIDVATDNRFPRSTLLADRGVNACEKSMMPTWPSDDFAHGFGSSRCQHQPADDLAGLEFVERFVDRRKRPGADGQVGHTLAPHQIKQFRELGQAAD